MSRASFRRKTSAVSLCKSIESAIQWFLIHHGITFVTIHNPAVYLSGARVSTSPTLVPRLVGEPKSRISQNNLTLAPERYTAEFLYTEDLNTG